MGSEANSKLRVGKRSIEGTAQLEGGLLIFRGADQRLKVPFAELADARVDGGQLHFTHAGAPLALELGDKAAKWLEKIRNPPSLLDKLGIKPGMRVCVLGVDDDDFVKQLKGRVQKFDVKPKKGTNVFIFGIARVKQLEQLPQLRDCLTPAGSIWVVHTKGKEATIRDVDVFAAAKRAGLVDNKVASFSATHTAERLVIPLSKRPKK